MIQCGEWLAPGWRRDGHRPEPPIDGRDPIDVHIVWTGWFELARLLGVDFSCGLPKFGGTVQFQCR